MPGRQFTVAVENLDESGRAELGFGFEQAIG